MTVRDVVLPLPEDLYVRLEQTARATRQSFTDMLVRSMRAGSPPDWSQAPAEFQADLAALDRLADDALWRIARSRRSEADAERLRAYRHTSQANCGSPMVVDHLLPLSKGGVTEFENLCFACYRCNLFKGSRVEAVDPLNGEMTPLFHARHDHWNDHFVWDQAGLRILSLTATGRATIIALHMNNEVILDARRNWVRLGWQPSAE